MPRRAVTGGGAASGGLEYGIVASWRRASHTLTHTSKVKDQFNERPSKDILLVGQATIFLHNISTLTNTTNYTTNYTPYKLL